MNEIVRKLVNKVKYKINSINEMKTTAIYNKHLIYGHVKEFLNF